MNCDNIGICGHFVSCGHLGKICGHLGKICGHLWSFGTSLKEKNFGLYFLSVSWKINVSHSFENYWWYIYIGRIGIKSFYNITK